MHVLRASVAVIGASLILALPSLQAQEAQLGRVTLELEADRASVLERLEKRYHVVELGDGTGGGEETWSVMGGPAGDRIFLGYVSFDDGRLIRVGRDWNTSGSSGTRLDLAQNIVDALQHLQLQEALPSGEVAMCALAPSTNRQPGITVTGIEISCGSRRVSIQVVRHRQGDGVTVTEIVEPLQ